MKKQIMAAAFLLMLCFTGYAASEQATGSSWDFFGVPAAGAAITPTPAPNAFRFRDGIRWGMNTQQVQALETTPMTERTMNQWSVMLTDTRVAVSRFTADLVFMFRDDRLLMITYEFLKGSDDDFLYLQGALDSVYGEDQEAEAVKVKALMDAINPSRYQSGQISRARQWITADGTTVYLYYYAADAFAIMYTSPELGNRIYQTDGL